MNDDDQFSLFPDDDDDDDDDDDEPLRDAYEVRPGLYRHDGPDTSKDAAHRKAAKFGSQRAYLKVLFHDRGSEGYTDFEVGPLLERKFYEAQVRPRRGELIRDGWVLLDEVRQRQAPSGQWVQVHYFNPDAENQYQAWLAAHPKPDA